MKLLISLLIFAGALCAQAPGTVTIVSQVVITSVAGTLTCTMTNQAPDLPTGVQIKCTVGSLDVLTMSAVMPIGATGVVGSAKNASDNITWLLSRAAAGGPIAWQMVANGSLKSGTF